MADINVDNHKLIYHPERVAEWKKTGDCYPIYVEIGPTNRCNHKCKFCALDWIEHGGYDIDSSKLSESLEDMALHGVKSVMFAGEGEPLLYKDISKIVKFSKEKGLDISITTNGVLFNQKKAEEVLPYLSWIRFSVDAGTKETYAKIHKTRQQDFDRLMKNLACAADIKRKNNYKVAIGVQALLIQDNINEIFLLAEKLKEIGVDNLQIKPYSHHPSSKNDLSVDYSEAEKLREKIEPLSAQHFKVLYRTQTIKRLKQPRNYKECYGLPFFALIEAKGNVVPCNLFYNNEEFYYGNINESLFSDIWKSEKRKKVLKKISEGGIEKCREGCRLDVINRYLERLVNPYPHDNFL